MKKILIIIFLSLCIFQMVVLATAIDIGTTAEDGDDWWGVDNTYISINNVANESGKITTVEIYAKDGQDLAGCEVATFIKVDADHWTTRDSEIVNNGVDGAGVVIGGSKKTFTVDLDVTAGDYIGIYFTSGQIESTSSGSGIEYHNGDNIPCTNVSGWSTVANYTISLYATGATVEVGTVNAIFWPNF